MWIVSDMTMCPKPVTLVRKRSLASHDESAYVAPRMSPLSPSAFVTVIVHLRSMWPNSPVSSRAVLPCITVVLPDSRDVYKSKDWRLDRMTSVDLHTYCEPLCLSVVPCFVRSRWYCPFPPISIQCQFCDLLHTGMYDSRYIFVLQGQCRDCQHSMYHTTQYTYWSEYCTVQHFAHTMQQTFINLYSTILMYYSMIG